MATRTLENRGKFEQSKLVSQSDKSIPGHHRYAREFGSKRPKWLCIAVDLQSPRINGIEFHLSQELCDETLDETHLHNRPNSAC